MAEKLSVSTRTVQKWRKARVLDEAIISHIGRIIIYDLEKVYRCLNYRQQAPRTRIV